VEEKQRFAKPGTPNPTVKIFVKKMRANGTDDHQEVIPPKDFLDKYGREEHAVFRMYWITDEKLGVVWINRFQNASSTTGKLQIVFNKLSKVQLFKDMFG
jgi:hypothetical protein